MAFRNSEGKRGFIELELQRHGRILTIRIPKAWGTIKSIMVFLKKCLLRRKPCPLRCFTVVSVTVLVAVVVKICTVFFKEPSNRRKV